MVLLGQEPATGGAVRDALTEPGTGNMERAAWYPALTTLVPGSRFPSPLSLVGKRGLALRAEVTRTPTPSMLLP
jgi:hypothetical protein